MYLIYWLKLIKIIIYSYPLRCHWSSKTHRTLSSISIVSLTPTSMASALSPSLSTRSRESEDVSASSSARSSDWTPNSEPVSSPRHSAMLLPVWLPIPRDTVFPGGSSTDRGITRRERICRLPPTSSKPSSEKMLRDFSRSEVTGASGTSGDLRLGDSTLKLQADVEKLSVSRERKSDRT